MLRIPLKSVLPHLVAVVVFLVITLSYFSPILEGKRIWQSDAVQFTGVAKEITDFREKTGQEALWTNSLFGGMPAYLISVVYKSNLFRYIDRYLALGLITPAKFLFLSLLGFYLLLLAFRVNPWLSLVGAIAFAFSTYFFIIEAVGHNTKALALAYMAPLLGGVYLTLRKNLWLGAAVTGIFLALQINANHYQITYYTGILIFILGLVELVYHVKGNELLPFLKAVGVLLLVLVLAVGSHITSTLLVLEYGKVSMRGKSELTSDQGNKTGGLDRDYILNDYSYGIAETMNLLIPNFMGGASGGFDTKSKTYSLLQQNNVPNAKQFVERVPLAYWGPQRYTAGPMYIGAVVIFLFFMGMFLVDNRLRWWLLASTLLAILLAWGKHFAFLSDLFISYFPGYNKFRTVSMILVIPMLTMPLMGILGVSRIISGEATKKEFYTALKWSLGITGGITLFFTLFPGMLFSFSAPIDEQLKSQGGGFLIDAIRDDRKSLLQQDALRSLIFILLSATLLWSFFQKKISLAIFLPGLALLLLVDLWPVNRRYLNSDNFSTRRQVAQPFQPSQADLQILRDPDPDFRVFNLTVDPFNDASTSYFHKSIGGYHGAKMKRYQELIENHIAKNNMTVLDMLNTKYFIIPGEKNQPVAKYNGEALGNAWFVDSARIVRNADEEIAALGNFNPAATAIVDQRFDIPLGQWDGQSDSTATIRMLSYAPNHLVYESTSSVEGLAVFSEIYYDKGWDAYVDGEKCDYLRCNYVLRGMVLPAGPHKVEFKFAPKSYFIGEKISLASSSLLVVFLIGIIGWQLSRTGRKEEQQTT